MAVVELYYSVIGRTHHFAILPFHRHGLDIIAFFGTKLTCVSPSVNGEPLLQWCFRRRQTDGPDGAELEQSLVDVSVHFHDHQISATVAAELGPIGMHK